MAIVDSPIVVVKSINLGEVGEGQPLVLWSRSDTDCPWPPPLSGTWWSAPLSVLIWISSSLVSWSGSLIINCPIYVLIVLWHDHSRHLLKALVRLVQIDHPPRVKLFVISETLNMNMNFQCPWYIQMWLWCFIQSISKCLPKWKRKGKTRRKWKKCSCPVSALDLPGGAS